MGRKEIQKPEMILYRPTSQSLIEYQTRIKDELKKLQKWIHTCDYKES